jgi:hypothetical protein
MCVMVYVASDEPLPRIAWDERAPSFYVDDVTDSDRTVSGRFTLPHVCYVGSHEGCGCGFQFGEYPEVEEPDDTAAARRSREQLVDYLQQQLAAGRRLELYACWAGDEAEPADHTGVITPSQLLVERTYFREREFLSVVESDA